MSDTPQILCCADEAYRMPLAAMVRSLLDNTDGPVSVHVVDAGLTGRTRERLMRSWDGADIHWLQPSFARLKGVPVSGHASAANYVRLLIEDLLPADMTRVLYLDVDLVVLEDVRALWSLPLDDVVCLAARDVIIPNVDVTQAPNFERAAPYVDLTDPIRNYEALGLDGAAPYMNTGVLLIDLEQWRREDMGTQLLACLTAHRDHVRLWDQYPLNVVLHGRWRELDPTWNGQIQVHEYPDWRASPYDEETFETVRKRPRILHFAASQKPWQPDWDYPHAGHFFTYLDRTDWAGWRPRRPFVRWDRTRTWRSLRRRTRRLLTRLRTRGR